MGWDFIIPGDLQFEVLETAEIVVPASDDTLVRPPSDLYFVKTPGAEYMLFIRSA